MAANTYIVGNDGDVTIGSVDLMKVRSFAATVSRTKQDVTAFGDTEAAVECLRRGATDYLLDQGFEGTVSVRGGTGAWARSGRPLVR